MKDRLLSTEINNRKTSIFLGLIIFLAFCLRIAGIRYGLPLWLVADEPPFVYAPLKMLELHSLIPALHPGEFLKIFYFPTFLAYANIIMFIPVLIYKLILSGFDSLVMKESIALNSSSLFLSARLLSVALGTCTVYLVYKIAQAIFVNSRTALLSSLIIATSFLHVNFSHWARHWSAVTFLGALTLYFLTRSDWSESKKYILASISAGIAFGVNYQGGTIAALIILWFIFVDRLFSKQNIVKKYVLVSVAAFVGIVVIAIFLYPQNLATVTSSDIARFYPEGRSLSGFLAGYLFYAEFLIKTEPALLLGLLLGSIFAISKRSKEIITLIIFCIVYIAMFYAFFFHLGRYLLTLYPIFSVIAAYGFLQAISAFNNLRGVATAICALGVISMIIYSIRFDQLLVRNDTRVQARNWVINNIPESSKIAVLARLTRLPGMKESIHEQYMIDPNSLRSIDYAEMKASEMPRVRFHALNLDTVKSVDLYRNLLEYLRNNNYEYVLFSPELAKNRGVYDQLESSGEVLKVVNGYNETDEKSDLSNGYGVGYFPAFRLENNGPTIVIKKL